MGGCPCESDDVDLLDDHLDAFHNVTVSSDATWRRIVHASTVAISTSTILLNALSMLAIGCSRPPKSANLRISSSSTDRSTPPPNCETHFAASSGTRNLQSIFVSSPV